jgi:hypothetical protein
MRDDVRPPLSLGRDEVDMNSSEELGNRLEIEAEMAEEELEVETYQDI